MLRRLPTRAQRRRTAEQEHVEAGAVASATTRFIVESLEIRKIAV